MRLTIIKTGEVPEPLHAEFGLYPPMFAALFDAAGANFSYGAVDLVGGEALPDPAGLEAIVITGSAFGVYDLEPWMEPLRAFVRAAYQVETPMLGVCFGHQIIADALGGTVRKSEKGWSMGPHDYRLAARPAFLADAKPDWRLIAMHQDQVVAPPAEAETWLASDFTPHAGLYYANGAAFSIQPHPEFSPAYADALMEFRALKFPPDRVAGARARLGERLDSLDMGRHLAGQFDRLRGLAAAAQ